jgi:ATP-grasp in the biosynthetic pathway with Ter operon
LTLRPLRVLLTATGAPGAARLVRALQRNGERELAVIGTDMSERSGGRFLCDEFHVVPPGSSDEFAPAVAELARREGADVVFPQSSGEVVRFAASRELFPMPLMIASSAAIAACDDKAATMALAERAGVRAPRALLARTPEEFRAAAAELGYPGNDVCMKPPQAKGSRGFRVLSAGVDRRWALLEARPGPLPLSVDDALDAIGETDFPPLLVMELVTGKEHTVDGICRGGRMVLGHAKTREAMRAGLAMYFETAAQPELEAAARRLVAELALDWFVNVQFIGEHLLEINPRISTIVYQDDLNLPYLAVRHAVGELDEEQLASYQAAVRPTRRALRYYDQVEYDEP